MIGSNTQSSISMLFSAGLLKKHETDVISVGDFPKDREDIERAKVVVKVKNAMKDGKTVILVNSDPIRSSFYDVFNRYFSVSTDKTKYYALVSIGAYMRSCPVHPNFKIIVHQPWSTLTQTPAPFLNRFEKYYVSIHENISEKIINTLKSNRFVPLKKQTTLYVTGIPNKTSQSKIETYFSQFGKVTEIRLIPTFDENISAFIDYSEDVRYKTRYSCFNMIIFSQTTTD